MSFNTCKFGLHSPSKNLCVRSVLVTSFSVKIKVNQINIIYRSGTKAIFSLNFKKYYIARTNAAYLFAIKTYLLVQQQSLILIGH